MRSDRVLGLVMIVKDEARGIAATLASVRSAIDHWTILDTGSTDGTQDLIRRELAGIPGHLFEEPFVDFATTRNRCLDLHGAATDYVIMLSGDDVLCGADALRTALEHATEEVFLVDRVTGYDTYQQPMMFRPDAGWRYVGRTHELLTKSDRFATVPISGVSVTRPHDGGDKRLRWRLDLELLLADFEADPNSARACFYIAQTYECLGMSHEALAWYNRRVAIPGWHDETYEALFRRARVMATIGAAWTAVLQAYLDAYAYDPRRAEPLYAIADGYHRAGHRALAHLFASSASALTRPGTAGFVRTEVYDHLAKDLARSTRPVVQDKMS